MLQETVDERKSVGLLEKGFYYIRTGRAVWGRVQIVDRTRRSVRIFWIETRRHRRRGKWRTRRLRCIEDLPISTIIVARRYYM